MKKTITNLSLILLPLVAVTSLVHAQSDYSGYGGSGHIDANNYYPNDAGGAGTYSFLGQTYQDPDYQALSYPAAPNPAPSYEEQVAVVQQPYYEEAQYAQYAPEAYQQPQPSSYQSSYQPLAQAAPVAYVPPAPQPAPQPKLSAAELDQQLLDMVRAGNIGQINRLMRMGANPDYKAYANDMSAMDWVVKAGWVKIAEALQQAGADFNKRGDAGITYLHQAAAAGKLPMVKFLVQAGLSPNTATNKRWSPLHHAARFGHESVVEYLLRAGANPMLRNSDGFTPQQLALNVKNYGIARMM